MKYIFIITFFAVALISCKKKDYLQGGPGLPDLLVECDCDTIPPFTGGGPNATYPTIQDSTVYLHPNFNPTNDNEIIFFDQDTYGVNGGIYKLNLITNLKTPVYTGIPISSNITWSRKDWIIFQKTADFNLYKIKSNGDSLTQLTFQGEFFHPQWNYEGTKFVAFRKNTNKVIVLNENGSALDTLIGWTGTGDWKHPQYIAGRPQSTRIVIMNVESKNVVREISNELPGTFGTSGWATDNKIIYENGEGLFTYWINSGLKQKMRNSCNANFYGVMSRNSTSTKLIFSRSELKLIDVNGEQTLLRDVKLVMMNTDGSNEHEIVIP